MLASPKVKKAFDLSQEPDKVRDAYGRTTYGQSCLLARRLIEAGVRFVTVYYSHVDRRHRERRLGHARRQLQPAQEPAPADHRPGRADPDRRPRPRGACSTRPWSSGWASSAARPRSMNTASSAPTAATTGRTATPSCSPAAASPRRDLRLQRPDRRLPGHRPRHPRRRRRDHVLGPRHRPRPPSSTTPSTAPCPSPRASRSRRSFLESPMIGRGEVAGHED